jgi:zinc transporter ZupT
MLAIFFTICMFISTLIGGWFAIRHTKQLRHILGFTAGVIMGVLAFDVLPEMFHIIEEFELSATGPMIALIVGFLAFHIIEKLLLLHHEHETQYGKHRHPQVGVFSSLALGGHSLLDGVGIGLAFQVNVAVGVAVSLALVAHKFADGLNAASLMLAHKNTLKRTVYMCSMPYCRYSVRCLRSFSSFQNSTCHCTWASLPARSCTSAPATFCPRPTTKNPTASPSS